MRLAGVLLLLTLLLTLLPDAWAQPNVQQADERLVFGSFHREGNAANWAARLSSLLNQSIEVNPYHRQGTTYYRVVTAPLDRQTLQQLRLRARREGLDVWRLIDEPQQEVAAGLASKQPAPDEEQDAGEQATQKPDLAPTPARPGAQQVVQQSVNQPVKRAIPASPVRPADAPTSASVRTEFDWDVAVQGRGFRDDGVAGQDQLEGSVALQLEYYLGWQDERQSITFTPFMRYDSADSRRSHADVRELFYTLVGSNWDLHIGAKKVFWGVTEFHHLVDVINQTDLVENIDGEDKLGQPMVQTSFVGNWGLLDLYALIGFRERTFPGEDGRLRHPFHISSDGNYESGAGKNHIDAALRWSHSLGPLEFGLHHFTGTSREPLFDVVSLPDGEFKLEPYYVQINQTGMDAQAIFGDWVFKMEALHRSGFDDRYSAVNLGIERTFFAVGGSAADIGAVVEYMWDERGNEAFNTLFENDLVIGGRFSFNNLADTQLLVGLITDLDTQETVFSLEGSHRIGEDWLISVEGRGFAGGEDYRPDQVFNSLTDREFKSSWLQEEDYFQLEIKKFF